MERDIQGDIDHAARHHEAAKETWIRWKMAKLNTAGSRRNVVVLIAVSGRVEGVGWAEVIMDEDVMDEAGNVAARGVLASYVGRGVVEAYQRLRVKESEDQGI
jgi:hypothetical protein